MMNYIRKTLKRRNEWFHVEEKVADSSPSSKAFMRLPERDIRVRVG
jgi:hypothetical protein